MHREKVRKKFCICFLFLVHSLVSTFVVVAITRGVLDGLRVIMFRGMYRISSIWTALTATANRAVLYRRYLYTAPILLS